MLHHSAQLVYVLLYKFCNRTRPIKLKEIICLHYIGC